jgi:hypothetical protein
MLQEVNKYPWFKDLKSVADIILPGLFPEKCPLTNVIFKFIENPYGFKFYITIFTKVCPNHKWIYAEGR